MHLLLILYLNNQIFNTTKIDEIISIKLLTKKNDSTRELSGIVSLAILYGPCGNQNLNTSYMKESDYGLL